MIDLVTTIGGAGASFLFGTVVSNWWNRARPLAILQGFADLSSEADTFAFPSQLKGLTSQSWATDDLEEGDSSLLDIKAANEIAVYVSKRNASGVRTLREILPSLRNSASPEAIVPLVRQFIVHAGICNPLAMGIMRGDVPVAAPPVDVDSIPVILVEESDEDGGCFVVVWQGATSRLGQGLKDKPYRRTRLLPFVAALRHLHMPTIVATLEALLPQLEAQTKLHEEIAAVTTPILDQGTRWAAKVLVANYGAAPMMLWPDAVLTVRHKPSKARFVIESYLAVEASSAQTVRPLEGLHVLAPGDKAPLWVITRAAQRDIPNGPILRAHYQQKDAEASIRLRVTRRAAFLGAKADTNNASFAETVELPRSRAT